MLSVVGLHVGHHVIECETDECEGGPPDRYYLAEGFSRHHAQEASQAYQPVCTDAAQEDHVPFRRDRLCGGEFDGFGLVRWEVEDAAVADDETRDEKGARQVTKERYRPMHEHFQR